jgi:regulator of RNase E activity RraA
MLLKNRPDTVRCAPDWKRFTDNELAPLQDFPAAIISDALGRMSCMDSRIKRYAGTGNLVGNALPINVAAGDNLGVHRALDDALPGDVLVINGHQGTDRAILGDLLGELMVRAGVKGAIIDGPTRDIEDLRSMGLHIYATSLTVAGPWKNGPAEVGFPVACGGAVVAPGDVIVGDDDGIVVIPAERLSEAIDGAKNSLSFEDDFRARIHSEWAPRSQTSNL